MMSLPVVAIADLANPAELFRCDFYRAQLSAGSCIARQGATKEVRTGSHGKVYEKRIVPKLYEYCASGKCEQGAAVKAKLPDYEPPDKVEQQKRARRAAGAANAKRIEEQIAAKVASGELRVADPLPPVIADDMAAGLATAAQQAERDRVAAAVEEVRPEVAARAGATRKGWDAFRARKEAGRKAEAAPAPAEPKGEGMETQKCAAHGCKQQVRIASKSGKCRWCLRGYRLDSPQHGVLPPSEAGGTKSARQAAKRKQLNRNGDPAQPRPIPPAQPVVHGGLLQAQPADLEQLLEQRRAHHLAEAERCGRALKALRGAA